MQMKTAVGGTLGILTAKAGEIVHGQPSTTLASLGSTSCPGVSYGRHCSPLQSQPATNQNSDMSQKYCSEGL
jgi:hypothetical protein